MKDLWKYFDSVLFHFFKVYREAAFMPTDKS
jgi:hypothetical protein